MTPRSFQRPMGQRGSTLVEFALVVLVFLSLLFGIMDFARGLYAYHAVSHAAREGTRYAIVRGSTSKSPATAADVASFVKSSSPGLDPNAMTVNTVWKPDNKAGSLVQVSVQYNFGFVFPLLPSSSLMMASTSEMVISQ